ncbi:MAG TPA: GntR family transcriptional regulator [Streptosporangiaceae bacterium]|nr:GntR family transcriptional regulator [Streptosporangiaceae bacterium]
MVPEADASLRELSLSISRGSPVPLHHQFRQLLQEQIERGRLHPGQQIPHERQYAEQLGISLAPVRQALLDLVRQGYLRRVRGKGTFVRDDKVIEKISLLGSFTDSLRGQGLEPAFTVTCAEAVTPPREVRDAFAGRPQRLFRLDRLASAAGGPLALLTAWLDPSRFPDLAELDFTKVPLYATLERLYGVQMGRAVSTIEVVQLREDEAGLLQLPLGAAALQVQGTTFDQDDRATEVSRVLYRADRFTFSLESHRVGGELKHIIGPVPDEPTSPSGPGQPGHARRK